MNVIIAKTVSVKHLTTCFWPRRRAEKGRKCIVLDCGPDIGVLSEPRRREWWRMLHRSRSISNPLWREVQWWNERHFQRSMFGTPWRGSLQGFVRSELGDHFVVGFHNYFAQYQYANLMEFQWIFAGNIIDFIKISWCFLFVLGISNCWHVDQFRNWTTVYDFH